MIRIRYGLKGGALTSGIGDPIKVFRELASLFALIRVRTKEEVTNLQPKRGLPPKINPAYTLISDIQPPKP